MNSLNTLKILVVFLGGLVVALGSALIYVKSSPQNNLPPIQTVAHAATPTQEQPVPQAAPQPAAPATAVETPAPVAEEAPVPKEKPVVKRHKVHTPVRERDAAYDPKPQAAPVQQLAQNNVPPVPAPAPTMQAEPQAQVPPPPPPPQPQTVTLEAGTHISVRINQTLSTENNYPGDTFRATLTSPIIRNGFIIADRGSQGMGRVVDAEKAGRVKGLAEITLGLTSINTTDGQRIQIQTNTTSVQGQASRKRDVAEVAGGSALGAIIGAIAGGGKGAAIGAGAGGAAGTGGVLLTRGKPAVVNAETPLNFQLNAPVTITEKLNQ